MPRTVPPHPNLRGPLQRVTVPGHWRTYKGEKRWMPEQSYFKKAR